MDVAFIGDFEWWPNLVAIRWFLEEVFPHTSGAVRLNLFGPRSERAAPGHPGVVAHGVVDEFSEVCRRCSLMICPEFLGGGVSGGAWPAW